MLKFNETCFYLFMRLKEPLLPWFVECNHRTGYGAIKSSTFIYSMTARAQPSGHFITLLPHIPRLLVYIICFRYLHVLNSILLFTHVVRGYVPHFTVFLIESRIWLFLFEYHKFNFYVSSFNDSKTWLQIFFIFPIPFELIISKCLNTMLLIFDDELVIKAMFFLISMCL